MTDRICPRCGANLTDAYCEYCGWNSPKIIQDKTLTLSGVLCSLTVTKEISTFNPQIGSPFIIVNKEIAQISSSQAPMVGTGELSLLTVTGIMQKINFLYPQNPNMGEIASYLLYVAPEAKFQRIEPNEQSVNISGVKCPKCKSNNTKMSGESRKFSVLKILLGIMLLSMGIGVTAGGIAPQIILIIGGIALVANGLSLVGKKKSNCFCMNCRNRFRV